MSQDVHISVVGQHFVEGIVRSVPLIENFLDCVFTVAELEPGRTFICFPAGITLYAQVQPAGLARVSHCLIQGTPVARALSATDVWELPFGKGKNVGNGLPRPLEFLAGGWQLNGVVQRQSGPPLGFGDNLDAVHRGTSWLVRTPNAVLVGVVLGVNRFG
jgi:hypothetical protein